MESQGNALKEVRQILRSLLPLRWQIAKGDVMKIARTSRLIVLAPGLMLALLLFLVGTLKIEQPATAQQRTGSQELSLEANSKDVTATTNTTSTTRGDAQLALTGTFNEFSLPKNAHPQLMAVAPDGSIFFAQAGGNKIGQIVSPATADTGKVTVREFTVPTANSYPSGIVVAPDGMVWFTEQNGHKIGKLDPLAGTITEYPTPTPNSGPVGITVGPDNNIWFTEAYAGKIGMLDPNNPSKMADYRIPTAVSAPLWITTGPDGALWFVGVRSHKLGRIDPVSKAIVEYPTPTPLSGPVSVLVGPDGALWIAELMVDKIARFDTKTRKYTDEILINSGKNGSRSGPGILVNGPDGHIWFTEMFGNQIARINPMSRQVHEFQVPSALATGRDGEPTTMVAVPGTATEAARDASMNLKAGERMGPTGGPGGIAVGADGNIWYTSIFNDKVSRLQVGGRLAK
jgi:virginiamycin B lyase